MLLSKNKVTGIWRISPGARGEGWSDCLSNEVIGIGYIHDDDLHGYSQDKVIEYMRKKGRQAPGYLSGPNNFFFNIKKGHIVVAYSSPTTIYGVGIVASNEWKFNPKVNRNTYWLRNTRKVTWLTSFSQTRIDDKEIIKKLGKTLALDIIPEDFFIEKLLPLFPEELLMNVYAIQYSNETIQPLFSNVEEDEQSIIDERLEEKKELRYHKSFERNQVLSKRAKEIHGYTCMACKFNFKEKYGEIGENFIEAHHLVQLADLPNNTKLSPKDDFAVLCSNCHKMIHKFENIPTIEEFKKIIK